MPLPQENRTNCIASLKLRLDSVCVLCVNMGVYLCSSGNRTFAQLATDSNLAGELCDASCVSAVLLSFLSCFPLSLPSSFTCFLLVEGMKHTMSGRKSGDFAFIPKLIYLHSNRCAGLLYVLYI